MSQEEDRPDVSAPEPGDSDTPSTPEPAEVPPDHLTEGDETPEIVQPTPEPPPVEADEEIKAETSTPEPDWVEPDTAELVYDRRTPEPPSVEGDETEEEE